MNRVKMNKRLTFIAVIVSIIGVYLIWRLMVITSDNEYYSSFDMSAPREVTVVCSYGDIYDRNGIPLVNRSDGYIAVINPETADKAALEGHILDKEKYLQCIDGKALFLCEVDSSEIGDETIITVKNRYDDDSVAAHIIGYINEEGGVSGLELAYNDVLREPQSSVTLKYSVDARSDMLEGSGLSMKWTSNYYTGIGTSIDYGIQLACEKAMENVNRGAAIVVDIHTGEICAVVSKPVFDQQNPADSLSSPDSPFINRAFSPYSVGSVFKLVTAGAALEYGITEDYLYDCKGSIYVRQDEFGCHRYGGHGLLDMRQAMVESCNPYFISLGQDIPTSFLHSFAERLGYGQAQRLTDNIYSLAGNLPTENELKVPEEKANFSFGQGMLTATPLQVTLMTAAIANDGQMPVPILIHGETDIVHDSIAVAVSPSFRRVMSKSVANKLRSYMVSTMYKENSAAVPEFTSGGGKTSTAQTWLFDENGQERLNCWFTGFFPADAPQYAVTVLIENGVSGNLTCGPVFKEIADSIKLDRYGTIKN